jgi:predicted SnoaL-like aldol condensation-catalyzing enzyme
MNNRQKVAELLKSIETGAVEPINYIDRNKYIQHNLETADGISGFEAIIKQFSGNSAKVNIVRIFEDGDFVFAHTEYNFSGAVSGFDIFRFENGKIVEHWDNLQTAIGMNSSGHTMTDGASLSDDLDETENNKILVRNFVEDILITGKMEKLSGYFYGDNYIQHNPGIPDQLSGLVKALGEWAKHGITLKYDKVHIVLGEGNFVLTVSEGQLANKHDSFYDLFRVDNGKIVEHWDVVEEIAPKESWKNNNGKFNFQKFASFTLTGR